MNRRKFITDIAKLTAGMSIINTPLAYSAVGPALLSTESQKRLAKIETIPKLFCTAYITPNAPGQENQEHLAAKYPLIIVPQDTRDHFVSWRNKVRELNPNIIMLAYQMVIEETAVPGPGHDRVREVINPWCKYTNCTVPMVGPTNRRRRLVDPRVIDWQQGFLDACYKTLTSYDYDGLFLDQCDVFNIASPITAVRNEMRAALQSTLLKLRAIIPNNIIIGNSMHSWAELNGEMNEARIKSIPNELNVFNHHKKPVVELVQSRLSGNLDKKLILSQMALAHSYGAFYGAAFDYQHILWINEFDTIINN